jgi:glucose/arabinose dehydrogenase
MVNMIVEMNRLRLQKASLLFLILIQLFLLSLRLNIYSIYSYADENDLYQYEIQRAFPNLSFNSPVGLHHPNDSTNRLFILEQQGRIYFFNNSDSSEFKELFLDITDRVLYGGEQGLLGMAFHPNFPENKHFYLDYTINNPRRTVISRFSLKENSSTEGDPDSELILLEINQPYSNHNGGQITFGPEDFLYIALGDGGSGGDPENNGQNLNTLLGSILRISVDQQTRDLNYGVPTDNPFVNNTQGYKEEIYAYGFRNPWKFSFDSLTNQLWVGDVGQNTIEEIDIVEKGKNYGWRIMEGSQCYIPATGCNTTDLIFPIYEYDHTQGQSITGGYVYRGTELSNLIGSYIYGDFGSGKIWALKYNETIVENSLLFDTELNIASFGTDRNKEIYLLDYDGVIYKLVDTNSDDQLTSENSEKHSSEPSSSNSSPLTSGEINDIPSWVSLIALVILALLVSHSRRI